MIKLDLIINRRAANRDEFWRMWGDGLRNFWLIFVNGTFGYKFGASRHLYMHGHIGYFYVVNLVWGFYDLMASHPMNDLFIRLRRLRSCLGIRYGYSELTSSRRRITMRSQVNHALRRLTSGLLASSDVSDCLGHVISPFTCLVNLRVNDHILVQRLRLLDSIIVNNGFWQSYFWRRIVSGPSVLKLRLSKSLIMWSGLI